MTRTLVIRQHGRAVWASSSPDKSTELTDKDRKYVVEMIRGIPNIAIGYYDLVLKCNGLELDHSIEIN